jgi:hypothetical protein
LAVREAARVTGSSERLPHAIRSGELKKEKKKEKKKENERKRSYGRFLWKPVLWSPPPAIFAAIPQQYSVP